MAAPRRVQMIPFSFHVPEAYYFVCGSYRVFDIFRDVKLHIEFSEEKSNRVLKGLSRFVGIGWTTGATNQMTIDGTLFEVSYTILNA